MDSLNIKGKQRFDIFENLIKDRILVKIQILDKDFEQLTIITDIKTKGGSPFFVMDPSSDFNKAIAGLKKWSFDFEFTANDGLQYLFSTSVGKKSGKEILIGFPEYIERIQRRENFRLDTPSGTKICFEMDAVKYEMDILNLSMGGALTEISIKINSGKELPPFKQAGKLQHIEIIPYSKECKPAYIKKALVLRVNNPDVGDGCNLGLQFTDIDRQEIGNLKTIIYNIQRLFLKRRIQTGS